jgi:hypothetical protein
VGFQRLPRRWLLLALWASFSWVRPPRTITE